MSDFHIIKSAIANQFNAMVEGDLFRTAIEGDALWETYLASFPAGSNPLFRKRMEHDCSCCKSFIRKVGGVVSICNGQIETIWDGHINNPVYGVVARAMSTLVKAAPIAGPFLSPEQSIGVDENYEKGFMTPWHHFHVKLPNARRNSGKNYLMDKKDIPTAFGDAVTTRELFHRGLTELTRDALDTAMELINANSLYRGQEQRHAVEAFLKLKVQFDKLTAAEQTLFSWSQYDKHHAVVTRIRNTAIGTLLIDLSEGLDLEDAVNKFEKSIMAPTNYKRSTALVSKAMVDKARIAVEELGLSTAMERRFAQLDDIRINNILWADRSTKAKLNNDPFEGVATKASAPKDLSRVDIVPIDKFLADILPNASFLELMLENVHANNLVSLIAPQHASAKPLFQWSNGFSWAYNGDVTDSIKERVKRAGGNVTGDLCCRLSWSNHDDLDVHMKEPGYEIYYGNKRLLSPNGGMLDVDMNAGHGHTREPVENIFYKDRKRMKPGAYSLYVHQFRKRETDSVGFEVEMDLMGDVQRFAYTKPLRDQERVIVAQFTVTKEGELKITHSLSSTTASKTVWGLKTNEFHPVSVLMRSPNHWDDQVGLGNKHYFFMLNGCVNEGEPRGFFNEFLRSDLAQHRKVLEIVGGKMKVSAANNQLSGVGFSETKHAEILVRVKGKISRTLKVLI